VDIGADASPSPKPKKGLRHALLNILDIAFDPIDTMLYISNMKGGQMGFREKIDWLTLVALVGGFGWYATALVRASHAAGESIDHGPGMWTALGLLFGVVVAITVWMVAATAVLAIRDPDAARAAADERDRLFRLRAAQLGYVVLILGVGGVFAAAHLGHSLFFVLNVLLAAVVIAEIARVARTLWLYRRG